MADGHDSGTVRRTVALPRVLLQAAEQCAPPSLRGSTSRLLAAALAEYVVAAERRRKLGEAMAQMAADAEIQRECAAIAREFAAAEGDKLPA